MDTPVFLPGESQGGGSLLGCRLWGRTESDTTEVTAAAAAEAQFSSVKSLSHVRLCNPMNCSPPGSHVPGILQARTMEWVAMPSSRGSS